MTNDSLIMLPIYIYISSNINFVIQNIAIFPGLYQTKK